MARRAIHRPQTREQIRAKLLALHPEWTDTPADLERLVDADLAMQQQASRMLGCLVVADDEPLAEGIETAPADDSPAPEDGA